MNLNNYGTCTCTSFLHTRKYYLKSASWKLESPAFFCFLNTQQRCSFLNLNLSLIVRPQLNNTRSMTLRGLIITRRIDVWRRYRLHNTTAVLKRTLSTPTSLNDSTVSPSSIFPLECIPQLHVVPTLPYVGSLISWHSNLPTKQKDNEFQWQLEMRKRFGDFYSYGLPGLGAGTHGKIYSTFTMILIFN
jgi:hypothetical protein